MIYSEVQKMVNFNLDFQVWVKTGELMVCKLKIKGRKIRKRTP